MQHTDIISSPSDSSHSFLPSHLPSADIILDNISGLGANVGVGWFTDSILGDIASLNPSSDDVLGSMAEFDESAMGVHRFSISSSSRSEPLREGSWDVDSPLSRRCPTDQGREMPETRDPLKDLHHWPERARDISSWQSGIIAQPNQKHWTTGGMNDKR